MLINDDGSYTARGAKVVSHTPMARLASPEELVGAALFLADEKLSGFITGVILPVDGGFLAAPGA
jgi:NAD(P)-dependent dehydrogenase (short-subunit alcohol dehydrogenase family)